MNTLSVIVIEVIRCGDGLLDYFSAHRPNTVLRGPRLDFDLEIIGLMSTVKSDTEFLNISYPYVTDRTSRSSSLLTGFYFDSRLVTICLVLFVKS